MKQLYLDCRSGISGDMTLSALIDLGADIEYIKNHLEQLPIDPFTLNVKQVNKKGISSKMLDLHFENEANGHHHHSDTHLHDHDDHSHHHDHFHRKASTIFEMIENSELPRRVKKRSMAVFQVIAEAEGKIHGVSPHDVHFHEVGAMDSIIDIIGVCLALENLAIDKISASPVPTGFGKLVMAHGLYPIPAPATAEILTGVPLANFQVEGELTTPTGAGFLKALAEEYGHIPPLTIEKIGYGAGKKDFAHPNVLRAVLFQPTSKPIQREFITVLECELDDFTGEGLGYIMEKALSEGALDIYFTPITMKKSRPGTLITVLTKQEHSGHIEELLLRETSTFGVRKSEWSRRILSRSFAKVETPYGEISVKIGYEAEEVYKISPEYEEVKKAAIQYNIPFMMVYSIVHELAREQLKR